MNNKGKLVIGFDARMVAYRQAGIGQYNLNLLRELAPLTAEQPDFELVIYQSRREKRPPAGWLPQSDGVGPAPEQAFSWPRHRSLWTPPHNRFEQVALPLELFPAGPEVFHSPDFIPPLRRPVWRGGRLGRIKSVITIHDLAFRHFPHLLTAESAAYYGQVKRAAESAQRIIAVSESTAGDITAQLAIPPGKIRVVYEAASPLYRPLAPHEISRLAAGEAAPVVAKLTGAGLQPDDQFFLFVSTIEPRKNLSTLLKAFRQMLSGLDGASQTPAPRLVLAGREGWLFEDIYRLAAELQLGPHLVWLGGVDTPELLYLYNRAAALAMPSLYEGFGLPPLEALACGCPVLAAATSSLPEVVGQAGTLLPAQDVTAWAMALRHSWENRQSHKAVARERGPARAAAFSWRRAARETLAVYREAAGRPQS